MNKENRDFEVKKNKLIALFITMRPKQWIKNGFVFAGLIFSKSFFDISAILTAIYAFVLFSVVSGGAYVVNDIIDRERDAIHPLKCKRPIASGRLKPVEALLYVTVLLMIALYISFKLNFKFFLILTAYFLLVLSYSIILKNIVILDIIVIALGFVLRTLGGTAAINVQISPWLIMCTTFLALFLALNKRKNELILLSEDAVNHRKNLEQYNHKLIDQMLPVATSTTIMSYSLYTFTSGKSHYMMLTIPFVIYGIFRYQYLVHSGEEGGSPETVFIKDKPLLFNVILWIISCIIIVAFFYQME